MAIFKHNRLLTLGLVSLLLIVVLVSGCGASTTPATSTTPLTTTSTAKPVTTAPASSATTKTTTSTTAAQAPAVELNISAASSLTDALKEINALYMQENKNVTVVANFASSGTLQKQIEQGAPVDVFISAGAKQMDALQSEDLLVKETRKNLLTNRAVLIVPKNSTLDITGFTDLTKNEVKKIAIGDPASVPAGTYGKQAFDLLGIYTEVQPKLILCTDVRQVLSYVEAGNVDAGIVYLTDVLVATGVKIVADAPVEVNAKIVYPIAAIQASKNIDAAKAYIAFLSGDEAQAIFDKYAFTVVKQ